MIRTVLSALLSHWRRRPFQLVTLILGLALATALWSGVQAINAEARKSYAAAADVLGGGGVSALTAPAAAPIPVETYVALRRAGWLVSPVIDGWIEGDRGRVRLLGVDPFTLPEASPAAGSLDTDDLAGLVAAGGDMLADPVTAGRLSAFGDRVVPREGLASGLVLTDLTVAAELTGQQGYSRLLIDPVQPLRQAPLDEAAPDLALSEPQTADDLGRLTDSFHLNLTAFGLLSFAVGLFIVNGAVGLAFEQRRSVFRTLRALGVPAGTLVGLLTIELLIFAVIAGAIGILLGYIIAASLLPDVAATLRGLYDASVEGTLTLSPAWWLSGLVIACLGTALAAAGGLLRVARMPPLAPARPRAWAMVSGRAIRSQLLLAGLCLALACLALVAGGGLAGGFVLLGGVLLAAALALPAVLSGLVALAGRSARTALSEWFWADTRQQLPGLSLALMALMLALSANIGVGTMVSSFRQTFTGWLDQRLVSDLYVSARDDAEGGRLRTFLEARAEGVLPIWNTEGDILGAPTEIYGMADHPIYARTWPLLASLPETWARMGRGGGVLVNEQLARREDLSPGDLLDLPGGFRDEILGVYSDYGNPLGQVVIPLQVLTDRYPEAERTDFGVLVGDGGTDDLRRALEGEFGLPADAMTDQAALKAFSLSIFERTFAVTGALNVLTLGVAGVAILTSLLTLASMRLPQLAPLWALGLTRGRLARIEFLRALVLAALTFVLSVPVGLGLAWILLAVINVEAFGWRLPMFVYPLQWLWLGLLSLAAAALAGLWPAVQLARRPPADLIRVFTHER
ncbi:ABC transporter permease [Silicimonas algicola]|uniref:Putative ABC transport system permease protein n=1 Tax=Silicimonas algicola TaxID=1826607 RepID=A0A316GCR5_9RHOB|nr:ABC transporter permease [Silicimonas algicola]AZQ67796.1 ABC transporter permease [Silicimonas algicola]PWK57786.1 putative ABC transport system permease protein [Silicimonas algicola]